jgi:hypothetical protein
VTDDARSRRYSARRAPDGDCFPPTSGSPCISPCCRWADLEEDAVGAADLVVQENLAEGFGLTVAETM